MSKEMRTDENLEKETTQPEQKKPAYGVVCNCKKLNVRKTPDASSKKNIACEIAADEKVAIDETGSTNEWYKVCTKSGVEGFCMRKYIKIDS